MVFSLFWFGHLQGYQDSLLTIYTKFVILPFGKNGYGIYDMAGNVWEWVGSLYKPYPYNATDGREILSASGSRVMRGGAWNTDKELTMSANRYVNAPTFTNNNLGFRCARDANP
jgi:formylglycine-generating enzyme required for sulfatase activity